MKEIYIRCEVHEIIYNLEVGKCAVCVWGEPTQQPLNDPVFEFKIKTLEDIKNYQKNKTIKCYSCDKYVLPAKKYTERKSICEECNNIL